MRRDELAVIYGQDPARMTDGLLDHIDLASLLPDQPRVGIKPNLVVSKPSSSGATTDPIIVERLLVRLRALGVEDIVILESAWVGDSTERAFDVCGYRELAAGYGVELLDLKGDRGISVRAGGMDLEVCERALALDFLINVPVLKAHCQTRLTCALKNLKGCIRDPEKRRYHTLGLHQPIAALNMALRSRLIIVDGIVGDLTYEEGGTPVHMNRLIAGLDPVLVDAYAARLIGYGPSDIEYIGLARGMGVGSDDIDGATVRELNRTDDSDVRYRAGDGAAPYAHMFDEDQACSACFGSLVHAMQRLADSGDLKNVTGPIHIGQGHRTTSGQGVGVGQCAMGLSRCLKGCPPTASEMVDFLRGK